MRRPRTYTIAAILLALVSLSAVVMEIPYLARGADYAPVSSDEPDPPFVFTVVNFAIAVLGFAASYGIWRMQKWGVVLGLVLAALNILITLPAVIFAPPLVLRLLGVLGIASCAAIIVLLLRSGPRPASVGSAR